MARIVMARIKAKPDTIKQVSLGLQCLLAPTRQEAGCIQYDLHQSSEDPTLFYFYEKWKDDEALFKHLKTPHVLTMIRETSNLLAEPPEIQRVESLPVF